MLPRGEAQASSLFGCRDLTFDSASVILDKFRCFPTIPLLAESCEELAKRAEYPTDRNLPQIFGLLRMIEDVDNLAKRTDPHQRDESLAARISHLQYKWRSLKESLPSHAVSSR